MFDPKAFPLPGSVASCVLPLCELVSPAKCFTFLGCISYTLPGYVREVLEIMTRPQRGIYVSFESAVIRFSREFVGGNGEKL